MRTLVVGDVHGCVTELRALLTAASYTRRDRLVLVGDLVAKGPDSSGVLAMCRELKALAAMGNHDAHVLKVLDGSPAKKHHLNVARSLTAADWKYLEALPAFVELPEHGALVVHAGLLPGIPPESQDPELMRNMRSFDEHGRPSKRIEGGTPWASRWPGPAFVVFGHDAVRGLQRHPHALGLDTGCVYGGSLTAVWLPERRLVTVKALRVWQTAGSE